MGSVHKYHVAVYLLLPSTLQPLLSNTITVIKDLVAKRGAGLAYLCTPTDAHLVPVAAVDAATSNYRRSPLWQQVLSALLACTKSRMTPNRKLLSWHYKALAQRHKAIVRQHTLDHDSIKSTMRASHQCYLQAPGPLRVRTALHSIFVMPWCRNKVNSIPDSPYCAKHQMLIRLNVLN
jgi:hypothetical protein